MTSSYSNHPAKAAACPASSFLILGLLNCLALQLSSVIPLILHLLILILPGTSGVPLGEAMLRFSQLVKSMYSSVLIFSSVSLEMVKLLQLTALRYLRRIKFPKEFERLFKFLQ